MNYYWQVFLRRLPYFLIVAMIIAAGAFVVATSLPPAFVSQSRLLLERSQIPSDLAKSTVTAPAAEQMQLLEQRLMTRANLLEIARRHNVLTGIAQMSPDQIVLAMRARTTIRSATRGDGPVTMTLAFEARSAQTAAAVLNDYVTLITQENVDFRTGRAGQTQQFFQQDVDRLANELGIQSQRILDFKRSNADALPDSMNFRMSRQTSLEERRAQAERELAGLREQRDRMVQVFEATGRVEGAGQTPAERELDKVRKELDTALLVYAPSNPRVKVLQARIAQMENAMVGTSEEGTTLLDVQLAQLDARIGVLANQRDGISTEMTKLEDAIARTPANAIALDGLERDYRNTQSQYNSAVGRLAQANTGERIELLSRGQRISVLEQPTVPSAPSKPNRLMIAGGGSAAGIAAGLALIVLMELLNKSARRPVDLVNKLGISPITTIPYIQDKGERSRQRRTRFGIAAAIVIGVPILVYGVHVFYQPLDLLAERVMNKLGMRW